MSECLNDIMTYDIMLECHTLLNGQYRVLYISLTVKLKCFNVVIY